MSQYKPARILLSLAFPFAILAYLGYLALIDPEVQFLSPARRGAWIVDTHQRVPGYPDAEFIRRFDLPAAPTTYPVRITVMREGDITVNGQPLAHVAAPQWKVAIPYDLGPALRGGPNEVRIRVHNRVAPPALLVEGPTEIRTDEQWMVATSNEKHGEARATVAFRDEKFLAPQPNALRASPWFHVWAAAFAAYCAFVLYAALPRRPPGPAPDQQRSAWQRRGGALCLFVGAVVGVVQLHNAWVYPSTRGFDAIQHADYVRLVAEQWRVPDVSDGWEMSQPPLYYVLGACVYTLFGGGAREATALKAVQLLSPLAMLATLAITWWLLGLVVATHPRARILGFVVAALLPVGFYMSPQITNEVFSALAIGGAMLLASRQILHRDGRWVAALVVGAGCGLALLSKYTGLFVFVSLLSLVGLRIVTAAPLTAGEADGGSVWRGRLRQVAWAGAFAGTTLALCGWLYARNAMKFGKPFMGAWDQGSGFNIVQGPGYRTPAFYGRFGDVFWHTLGRSRDSSFWDGLYGSLWADTHGMFLNAADQRTATLSTLCLWLALLPSVAILLGFLQAVRHLLTREWDHPYFLLVVNTVLTATAVLSFALQHPFYSNLKAHFALSLTPCAGVFAALGLEAMCQRLGRLRSLLYLNLVLLGGLVPYVFWYR